MGNSKEWRERQRDIEARMEQSDRIELDMNKKARRPKADNIR